MAPSATNTAIEDEIIMLETAYWDSMRANDVESSLSLTHDPCIVTGAQGPATFDHTAMRKMSQNKTWSLNDCTIDKMNVYAVSDDMAVLGYQITLQMEVEGKPATLNCAEGSTWVRKNGKWVCVLHCETPIGDPFGRQQDKAGE